MADQGGADGCGCLVLIALYFFVTWVVPGMWLWALWLYDKFV
jgi:hypothetical protein